jgi:hypothetical protein
MLFAGIFITPYFYPSFIKYVARRIAVLIRVLMIMFIVSILLTAASCKTCNCPAYTYKHSNKMPSENPYHPVKLKNISPGNNPA